MFQRLAVVVLFACVLGGFARTTGSQAPTFYPSPIVEKFDIWRSFTHDQKIIFYNGWANGLFTTTKDPGTLAFGSCLEQKLNWELIVAMIDKRNADHHEEWKNPMSTEIIEAITAEGSPCAGVRVGN